MNQAQTLEQMVQPALQGMTGVRTLAITSGKGGVGKTNVVVNLGLSLASKGLRVAVLDADYGLGNIDILLGLDPPHDLTDLLSGRVGLEGVLVEWEGLSILPAGSGIQSLAQLSPEQEDRLFRELARLASRVDLLIVDTAAGISNNVISLLLSADEVHLVVSTEPTSVVDAYAVVKVMGELDPSKPFGVITNMVGDDREGLELFGKLSRATRKFLGKRLEHLGSVRRDPRLIDAVRSQEPLVRFDPRSHAAQDFARLAQVVQRRLSREKKAGLV